MGAKRPGRSPTVGFDIWCCDRERINSVIRNETARPKALKKGARPKLRAVSGGENKALLGPHPRPRLQLYDKLIVVALGRSISGEASRA